MRVSSLTAVVGPMISVAIVVPSATAHEQQRRHYDLPAQELRDAVRSVARRVGYQLIADANAIRGKRAKALRGDFTIGEALAALLEGQDLGFEIKHRTIFIRAIRGSTPLTSLDDPTHV